MTDSHILTTADRKDIIAEIYKMYFNDVKFYFFKYTHDEMRAEDMTQDLFVKLMSYEDMIVGETARSFVFTIARRMVVDDVRHCEFVRRATLDYQHKMDENRFWQDCETLECKQIKEMERAFLAGLPVKMAQVYRMTRFDEKSSDELASELGISKRTVEYHLFVSRKEIRRKMRMAMSL